MRKNIYLFIILSLIFNCSTNKGIDNTEKNVHYDKELSKEKLDEYSIIPINYSYKKTYYRLIPYLYNNERNDFWKINGDFYNIKVKDFYNLYMSCEYWENSNPKNKLRVYLRISNTTKGSFSNSAIGVHSRNFGVFDPGKLTRNPYTSLEFSKIIEITRADDILKKIKNDTITVFINNEKFEFISPEIDLN